MLSTIATGFTMVQAQGETGRNLSCSHHVYCPCNPASGVMTDHAVQPPFNRINNGCTEIEPERCGRQDNIIDPNTGEKTGSASISQDGEHKKTCYIDDQGRTQCIQVSSNFFSSAIPILESWSLQ
jgi:hypothetical protein